MRPYNPGMIDRRRGPLTLALSVILHAFTHAYGTMLVPLYLMIAADLHLPGVKRAALIVTVYLLVYSIGSYGAGVLADRYSRRALLGWGLILNAAAIIAKGISTFIENDTRDALQFANDASQFSTCQCRDSRTTRSLSSR